MRQPRLTAEFQPQRDGSRPAGPVPAHDHGAAIGLDVTDYFLGLSLPDLRKAVDAAYRFVGKDLDFIAEAVPGLLARYPGQPFEVRLQGHEIDDFFRANRLELKDLTEGQLAGLREAYGAGPGARPFIAAEGPLDAYQAPKPVWRAKDGRVIELPEGELEFRLKDWRIGDEGGAELSTAQKLPWTVKVKPGAGWGMMVDLVAPDATERAVALEISKGNPRLMLYPDSNEVCATVALARDGVHVRADAAHSGHGDEPAMVVDRRGFTGAGVEAAPDFTGDDVEPLAFDDDAPAGPVL